MNVVLKVKMMWIFFKSNMEYLFLKFVKVFKIRIIVSCMKKEHFLGLLRIFLGWIFIWSFFDKLVGFGFATSSENAWINGGSPTYGFLANAVQGPFATLFNSIAGNVFIDWIFMIGILFIGSALILGVGTKIATYSGSLLFFFMWIAVLPPEHNPLIDEHIIYILALFVLERFNAGDYLGFGRKWKKLKFVKRNKWLA